MALPISSDVRYHRGGGQIRLELTGALDSTSVNAIRDELRLATDR